MLLLLLSNCTQATSVSDNRPCTCAEPPLLIELAETAPDIQRKHTYTGCISILEKSEKLGRVIFVSEIGVGVEGVSNCFRTFDVIYSK